MTSTSTTYYNRPKAGIGDYRYPLLSQTLNRFAKI